LPGVGGQDGRTAVDDAACARGCSTTIPFCIGISGSFTPELGLQYLAQADFVVAVGCSLAYHAGGGGQLWPKAKMLQIDIDPVAVNQGQEVARHHLRADARLGVEALTARCRRASKAGEATRWLHASAIRSQTATCSRSSPACSTRATWSRRSKKRFAAGVGDGEFGGHCSWFFAQMPSRPQEKFLTIREFGAIRQWDLVRHGSRRRAPRIEPWCYSTATAA
jgi:thiamine pyrophosphate-dependent acetolactate synthase large subunit-like protein